MKKLLLMTFGMTYIERLVLVYHKIDVLGVQTLLWDKFGKWASSGRTCRRYRKISRKYYPRVSNILFHIKYLE
jgi:hypothetical protein